MYIVETLDLRNKKETQEKGSYKLKEPGGVPWMQGLGDTGGPQGQGGAVVTSSQGGAMVLECIHCLCP